MLGSEAFAGRAEPEPGPWSLPGAALLPNFQDAVELFGNLGNLGLVSFVLLHLFLLLDVSPDGEDIVERGENSGGSLDGGGCWHLVVTLFDGGVSNEDDV